MAIGDGGNDLSLLQSAGLGIAMGNAVPEVIFHTICSCMCDCCCAPLMVLHDRLLMLLWAHSLEIDTVDAFAVNK